jgi:hypothetical protein
MFDGDELAVPLSLLIAASCTSWCGGSVVDSDVVVAANLLDIGRGFAKRVSGFRQT